MELDYYRSTVADLVSGIYRLCGKHRCADCPASVGDSCLAMLIDESFADIEEEVGAE